MTALRTLKLLLAGIIALFAAATVYTSVVIGERQEALRQTSRYNVAWLASQATTEFARFVERVSSLSVPGSGVDALPRAEPLVASIDRPGAVLKLREVVTPLEGKLARLAAAANRYGGELAAEDQKELLELHRTFSALAVGLICCGFALMGLLLWHNRLLGGAHRELNALTGNLRHTSDQLNAALNNMSQGLCMVDKDQRLTVCNAQLVSLFDLPAAAATPGRPVTEVFQASALAAGELHGISRLRDVLLHDDKAGSYVQELGDGRTIAVSH